jgi:uncharacterized membrane protein YwzB
VVVVVPVVLHLLLVQVVLEAVETEQTIQPMQVTERHLLAVAVAAVLTLKVTEVQAVLVLSSSKPINQLRPHLAVTSLINQLNKVLNIFSNKEEF